MFNYNVGYGSGDPIFDPSFFASQGTMAMQGLPDALALGAYRANQLSSANARASYWPQADVAKAQFGLQAEQLRQNAMNQRLGTLLPILLGAFQNLRGGSSGFQGFNSTFGQSGGFHQ